MFNAVAYWWFTGLLGLTCVPVWVLFAFAVRSEKDNTVASLAIGLFAAVLTSLFLGNVIAPNFTNPFYGG